MPAYVKKTQPQVEIPVMIGPTGAVALYRYATDAQTAALRDGATSAETIDAFARLLAALDSLCDDGGGWQRKASMPAQTRSEATHEPEKPVLPAETTPRGRDGPQLMPAQQAG